MKIGIIGGGPAGLYAAILLKKANPDHDITLIERNPPDATYGWGVVFSDRTLASFREADYPTYKDITDRFVIWDAIDVHYHDELIRCGGHVFSGISRKVLLNILQRRAAELGVEMNFFVEFTDHSVFAGHDLIIAADGVNSITRKAFADIFKPSIDYGKAKFIWFGTEKLFDSFTFIFRENEHGLFQVHAYPFEGETGTFIVECSEETWRRAGLDEASEEESIAYCEALFAPELKGRRLLSNRSLWINFTMVKNQHWYHDNIVLLGDAVHTAHFSIGSGTKLAMEDAIALANAFEEHPDIPSALAEYEMVRKPYAESLQRAAIESQRYFETLSNYTHLDPPQFTFNLLTRSGRISYDDLRLRDPHFIADVDQWFRQTEGGIRPQDGRAAFITPPPMFTPLALREIRLPNRVVLHPIATDADGNGRPTSTYAAQLQQSAAAGAGLVLTDTVAVSPEGRITPADMGIYDAEQQESWARVVAEMHRMSNTRVALQIGHAGPRGATRPRREGLDRPLLRGGWPLLAASALPYTHRSATPREMDGADMERVRDEFVRAATMAAAAGFDLLQLNFAHGYLLASFISPLTNKRTDRYGGALENRLRYPLEIIDAVRAAWPAAKPLSVAISASDYLKGGLDVEDAIEIAATFQAHGCDLIHTLGGQTAPDSIPEYGPAFLAPLSDRIGNATALPAMTGGNVKTADQVNTLLAAGRADLVVMDLSPVTEA